MAFFVARTSAAEDAPTTASRPTASRLTRLKRRDAQAWSDVFEEHHVVVFRAVLAQVRDTTVAEDITAQVFLEALQGIGRYRDRGKPFVAWLLSIARHRSTDWLRKQQREQQALSREAALSTVGTDETLPGDAYALLQPLTAEQREVVALRFIEGLSLEEVASATGRSPGAVKSLQHRALRQLRGALSTSPIGGDN
jgi:RNA polymerase sigma-70 factor, ECF subfamily